MRHPEFRIRVLKLLTAVAVCGCIFQPASCTTSTSTLGQQLAFEISNQLISSYVSDQFNLVGTGGF